MKNKFIIFFIALVILALALTGYKLIKSESDNGATITKLRSSGAQNNLIIERIQNSTNNPVSQEYVLVTLRTEWNGLYFETNSTSTSPSSLTSEEKLQIIKQSITPQEFINNLVPEIDEATTETGLGIGPETSGVNARRYVVQSPKTTSPIYFTVNDLINDSGTVYEAIDPTTKYDFVFVVEANDATTNTKLLEESNIQDVLDFINETIRPQAAEAKEFAIKKDLRGICEILVKEYETITKVYDALLEVLKSCEPKVIEHFENIHKRYSKELFNIYNSLESIMEKIAHETYKNIKKKKAFRFEESKGFLGEKIEKFAYETFWIDSDAVYKSLFYDDQTVDKMFKRSIKLLKNIELNTDDAFRETYNIIKNEVTKWQEPYELIRKHREIASDFEFSNTRHFAAKVYENVLKAYHTAILENISALRKKFAYFNGALSYSYIQTTQATIAHFEQQIHESEELYKKEPSRFSISHPREDEIVAKLKANFGFEKIEDFLTSKRNYLFKIIKYSKEQYLEINEDRIKFVTSKKEQYLDKIKDLEKIKEEI